MNKFEKKMLHAFVKLQVLLTVAYFITFVNFISNIKDPCVVAYVDYWVILLFKRS